MIVEGEVEEKGQKGRSIGSDFGGLRRAQFKILFNGSIKAAPPPPPQHNSGVFYKLSKVGGSWGRGKGEGVERGREGG